jgi:hypothetical protein
MPIVSVTIVPPEEFVTATSAVWARSNHASATPAPLVWMNWEALSAVPPVLADHTPEMSVVESGEYSFTVAFARGRTSPDEGSR